MWPDQIKAGLDHLSAVTLPKQPLGSLLQERKLRPSPQLRRGRWLHALGVRGEEFSSLG